jgi:hypothetical protein
MTGRDGLPSALSAWITPRAGRGVRRVVALGGQQRALASDRWTPVHTCSVTVTVPASVPLHRWHPVVDGLR